MVNLDSSIGKGLVRLARGGSLPSTESTREGAQLFLSDVSRTLRWHAVAATVAVAATPLVYQLTRVMAHRHRAELVGMAKDAIQREELFNGAEADGVMIDPSDEGGISISYNTHSRARQQQHRGGSVVDKSGAAADDGLAGSNAPASAHANSSQSGVTPSAIALRVGRHHSWALSSFAHQVLAAQRAPNVQFVRLCSRAAAVQYGVVVLRVATTSCACCIASYAITYSCCSLLDRLVPLTSTDAGLASLNGAGLTKDFFTAPVFDTATPPSTSCGCFYSLFGFSTSAAGVWSRLFPRFGALQTLFQRYCSRLQPLHMEWRTSASAAVGGAASHEAADSVWAALSPRGYCFVALLPRMPWRVWGGLEWLRQQASRALMRRRYASVERDKSNGRAGPAATPPPHQLTPNASISAAHSRTSTATQSQLTQQSALPSNSDHASAAGRHPKKLVHAPVVRLLTLIASDAAFAGIVYLATASVLSSDNSKGGWVRPLVRNTAGSRFDVFCWVEAGISAAALLFM